MSVNLFDHINVNAVDVDPGDRISLLINEALFDIRQDFFLIVIRIVIDQRNFRRVSDTIGRRERSRRQAVDFPFAVKTRHDLGSGHSNKKPRTISDTGFQTSLHVY